MKGTKARRLPLIFIACALALATLCVLIVLAYVNFRRLQDADRWNVHTYKVLDKIALLNSDLSEGESRIRGFALTGDRQLLAPVKDDENSAMKALAALRSLTSDRPEQEQRVRNFAIGYERWQHAFKALPGENFAVASARIQAQTRARRGILLSLKQQLQTIESSERTLLASRSEWQEMSRVSTAKSLLLGGIGTVLITSFFVLWLGLQARAVAKFNVQIRASEEQLRTVLDNAPLILYSVDLNENYVVFAGKALDNLGLDVEHIIGSPVVEVMGKDFNVEPIRAALRGESSVSLNKFRGFTFETHRRPLRDEAGALTGMIGVSIDVTERQKAETALRESEARFQTFMDNSPMLAFIKDSKGRMLYNNQPMLRRFEKTEAEMRGKDDFDLWPPDVARKLVEHDQIVLAGEEMLTVEESVPTPEGVSPTWLSFKFPLRDASGDKLVGALAIDITERKIAEERLKATSVLQRAILDGAPYSIIAASPDGVIQSFNRAAERLLGYRSDEVCGTRSLDSFHDETELDARAVQLGEELQRPITSGLEVLLFKPRAGMIEEREWTYVRRDGSRFPVRLSISVMHNSDGQITGYVAIGYDLTENQRAERIKNEFVSVVSHELRTPLTSIRGALGLLAGGVAGALPPKAQQMIEIAQKNGDRLVLLINDILDIEKIESGKMRFDLQPLALREWLESAVQQNTAYAQTLGVRLKIQDVETLNNIQVLGDENRLQQVLSNLLSNGCKFTPSGGVVTLGVHLEPGESGSGPSGLDEGGQVAESSRVCIRVSDQGAGVPEEFVPRLFEKFAQADSSSTRKQGGTGLGLAIARAIVEKHGGSLDYIAPTASAAAPGSAAGVLPGATFQFDLPLAMTNQPKGEAAEASGEIENAPRVLICEDDAKTAALLSATVTQNGFEVEIAGTLQEARNFIAKAAAENAEFAGMTLDLMLPDGEGTDLLTELRKAGNDLPIVVVSAFAEAGYLSGEALHVLDWLAKPLDPVRLQTALQRFRGRRLPRLLHVENDEDVQRIVAAILGENASILAASTLQQARHYLENEHFDLAILDISLPDGNGLDLVAHLNANDPPTPIILFSASEISQEQLQGVAASLVKSRTNNEVFRSTIRRFLGDGELPDKN